MVNEQPHMLQEHRPALKGWHRALLIIPAFLFVAGMFQVLGMFAAGLNPLSETTLTDSYTLLQTLVITVFSLAGTIFVVSLFVYYLDQSKLKQLGFQRRGFISDSLLGIVVGAVIISIGFYCLLWLGELSIVGTRFDICPLLAYMLIFIMISLSEELLFRGYILNNLMQSFNKYVALLVSSVLFALMHVINPNFGWLSLLSLTMAGMVLGLSYVYTKSLWFPIALHFSWNFFQGPIFGFNVSGNDNLYSIITQVRTKDSIINGGSFGFEGSILILGLELLALIFIWWRFGFKTSNGKNFLPA